MPSTMTVPASSTRTPSTAGRVGAGRHPAGGRAPSGHTTGQVEGLDLPGGAMVQSVER